MAESRNKAIATPTPRRAGDAVSIEDLQQQIRDTRGRLSANIFSMESQTLQVAKGYRAAASPFVRAASSSVNAGPGVFATTVRVARLVWGIANIVRSVSQPRTAAVVGATRPLPSSRR